MPQSYPPGLPVTKTFDRFRAQVWGDRCDLATVPKNRTRFPAGAIPRRRVRFAPARAERPGGKRPDTLKCPDSGFRRPCSLYQKAQFPTLFNYEDKSGDG